VIFCVNSAFVRLCILCLTPSFGVLRIIVGVAANALFTDARLGFAPMEIVAQSFGKTLGSVLLYLCL
jgi:hypothetical protein